MGELSDIYAEVSRGTYLRGYIDGLTKASWWHVSGVQHIGRRGVTLEEAIEEAKRKFGPTSTQRDSIDQ